MPLKDTHKNPKKTVRLDPDNIPYVEELEKSQKLNFTEAINRITREHRERKQTPQSSGEGIPEEIKAIFQGCKKKGCLAHPYYDSEAQEGICVFPFEGKEPKINRHSIVELKACSDTPILVSMARKKELEEEFQYRIETLIAQIDRTEIEHLYQIALVAKLKEKDEEHDKDVSEVHRIASMLDSSRKEVERLGRQLKPMKEIIEAKGISDDEVFEMKNVLLAKIEENNTLQDDNDYLRTRTEELSHDTLVEINKDVTHQLEDAKQLLKVQEAQTGNKIEEYKTEILKLEALNEIERQALKSVISQIRKTLIDFKQFVPTSLESYDIQQYIIAM